MWYAEELAFDGTWHPVKFDHRPSEKGPEQTRRTFRQIREIDPVYRNLTLRDLQNIYGTDAKFRSQA